MNNEEKNKEMNFNPVNFNNTVNPLNTEGKNNSNGATTGSVFPGGSTIEAYSYSNASTEIPAKVSVWTKLKGFLLQDVKLELTPREQKFVDFWKQEVTIDKVYNFLFQEIKFK